MAAVHHPAPGPLSAGSGARNAGVPTAVFPVVRSVYKLSIYRNPAPAGNPSPTKCWSASQKGPLPSLESGHLQRSSEGGHVLGGGEGRLVSQRQHFAPLNGKKGKKGNRRSPGRDCRIAFQLPCQCCHLAEKATCSPKLLCETHLKTFPGQETQYITELIVGVFFFLAKYPVCKVPRINSQHSTPPPFQSASAPCVLRKANGNRWHTQGVQNIRGVCLLVSRGSDQGPWRAELDGDLGDAGQPLEAPVLPTVTLLSPETDVPLELRGKPRVRPRGGGSWVEGRGRTFPPRLCAQPNGRPQVFTAGLEAYYCL